MCERKLVVQKISRAEVAVDGINWDFYRLYINW